MLSVSAAVTPMLYVLQGQIFAIFDCLYFQYIKITKLNKLIFAE